MPNMTGNPYTQRRFNQWALLLHVRKTLSLATAVLTDARIHWFPKLVFLSSVSGLLIALLFPEALGEVVANIFPIVGPVLGIPVDATIDWTAFAVATFNLMHLFPAEIVGEHYDRLFRKARS